MSAFCCAPLRKSSALFVISMFLCSSICPAQNSTKATLQYSTFVGGTGSSTYQIASDSSNNLYATGTVGFDLPTSPNTFQPYAKPSSLFSNAIFIAKFNNVGTSAIFSTYLEGNGYNFPFGIAVDSAHNIYVGLNTSSTNLPVVNGFQSSPKGGGEIYIAKFSASGKTLVYSSYYGGSQADYAGGMALDSEGRVYITGRTTSPDLPISAAAFHHTYNSGTDEVGFLARLDPRETGSSSLSYSTYFGVRVGGAGVAVDSAFNAYITTNGYHFYCVPQPGEGCFNPTPGTYGNLANTDNVGIYVAKFDASGSNLLWASFFGATGAWQAPQAIKVDSLNQPVVVGFVNLIGLITSGFPTTPGTFQPTPAGAHTGWLAKLSADGSRLLWGTYVGDGSEYPSGLAMNTDGEVAVTGRTDSGFIFPTTANALYPTSASSGSYVAKLNSSGAAEYASYVSNTFTGSNSVALNNKGDMFLGSWATSDFPTTTGAYSPGSGGGFVMRIGQNGPVTCVAGSATPDRSFVVCSPSSSGLTHEQVRFYARAKSNSGVQKISLLVDGTLKTQVPGSLIDKTLSLSPGAHNISFVAADSGGSFGKSYALYVNKNETALAINCSGASSDTVKICSPANNATVYNAFELSATAEASFNHISSMVLYLDGKRYAYSGTTPLDLKLRVPPGTHRFTVNAWNTRGDVFTKTIYLNVKSYF